MTYSCMASLLQCPHHAAFLEGYGHPMITVRDFEADAEDTQPPGCATIAEVQDAAGNIRRTRRYSRRTDSDIQYATEA